MKGNYKRRYGTATLSGIPVLYASDIDKSIVIKDPVIFQAVNCKAVWNLEGEIITLDKLKKYVGTINLDELFPNSDKIIFAIHRRGKTYKEWDDVYRRAHTKYSLKAYNSMKNKIKYDRMKQSKEGISKVFLGLISNLITKSEKVISTLSEVESSDDERESANDVLILLHEVVYENIEEDKLDFRKYMDNIQYESFYELMNLMENIENGEPTSLYVDEIKEQIETIKSIKWSV